MDKVVVMNDAPAVAVIGACQRAAKRAQMVLDGVVVSQGPWIVGPEDTGAGPITCRCGKPAKLIEGQRDEAGVAQLVPVCTVSNYTIERCPYAPGAPEEGEQ